MKKLTLIAGFCLLGTWVFGQQKKATVGLEIGPKLTWTEYDETGLGFGAGAFADLPLYRKLGLSTGLRFSQLNYNVALMCVPSPDFEGSCPRAVKRFYLLELPVGLTLDLSIRPDANWKVLWKAGYVLGRTLATESIIVRESGRENSAIWSYEKPMAYTHGAEFGFELQGFATRKYQIAFGPSIKLTQLLRGEFNNVTVIGFNLKLGRNLNLN